MSKILPLTLLTTYHLSLPFMPENPYLLMAHTLFWFMPALALTLKVGDTLLAKIIKTDVSTNNMTFLYLSAALGLGICAVSSFWAVLGMMGYVRHWIGLALWAAGFLSIFHVLKLLWGSSKNLFEINEESLGIQILVRLLQLATATWFFLYFWNCLTFTSDFDVLRYHWANVTQYINIGSIRPIPYNLFSYFPQNAEMIYMWHFLAGSQFSAKMFNFSVWLFFILGIVSFVRNHASSWSAWFIGAALSFLPIITWGYYSPKNDSFLALFEFLSIIFSLSALGDKDHAFMPSVYPGREKYLLLGGLFLGGAIGTKYTVYPLLIFLPIFVFGWLYFKDKLGRLKLLKCAGIFAAACLVFSFLWYLRNFMLTLNPIYPLGEKIFPSTYEDTTVQYGIKTLLEEARGIFRNNVSNPGKLLDHFLGVGTRYQLYYNPILMLLSPLFLVLFRPHCSYLTLCAIASFLSFMGGLFLTNFHYPSFIAQAALLVALLGIALDRIAIQKSALKYILTSLLIISIFNPRNSWAYQSAKSGIWIFLKGVKPKNIKMKISREEVRINDLEVVKEIVNQKLPKESCILFIGEIRAAGFKRKFYASSGFDMPVAEDWISQTKSPKDFYNLLKDKGITHLLVVSSGINPNYKKNIIVFLNNYGRPIFTHENKILLAEIAKSPAQSR